MAEFDTLAMFYKGLVTFLSSACKLGELGFVVDWWVVIGAVFSPIFGFRGRVKTKLLLASTTS